MIKYIICNISPIVFFNPNVSSNVETREIRNCIEGNGVFRFCH